MKRLVAFLGGLAVILVTTYAHASVDNWIYQLLGKHFNRNTGLLEVPAFACRASAPPVSLAGQATLYCDSVQGLQISIGGAAYVDLVEALVGDYVEGPVTSTSTALARWGDPTGDTLLDSGCTEDGSGNLDCAGAITASSFGADVKACTVAGECNITSIPENTTGGGEPSCATDCDPIAGSNYCFLPVDSGHVILCLDTAVVANLTHSDSGCFWRGSPPGATTYDAVWEAPGTFYITKVTCRASGGGTLPVDVAIDGTDVIATDLVCDADGEAEVQANFAGGYTMSAGQGLDVITGTKSGTVTQFSACVQGFYGD